MVYKENFVAVVKCNGKILREQNDVVTLPFGSDYTLLLKNLESRRASVKISIDGKDVLDGDEIVVEANDETELRGFITGTDVKNMFRFIQKTEKIADHRGDFIDDGIIRVEFAYEKKGETIQYYTPPLFRSTDIIGSRVFSKGSSSDFNCYHHSTTVCSDSLCNSSPAQDEGITVKGAETQQGFQYVTIGELEESSVIIIRLNGTTPSGKVAQQPITVKTKIVCSICGTKNSAGVKFCPECGTAVDY